MTTQILRISAPLTKTLETGLGARLSVNGENGPMENRLNVFKRGTSVFKRGLGGGHA